MCVPVLQAPFGAPLNCNLVVDREKFPGISIALKAVVYHWVMR